MTLVKMFCPRFVNIGNTSLSCTRQEGHEGPCQHLSFEPLPPPRCFCPHCGVELVLAPEGLQRAKP
jgi:hypothetical protein